MKRVSSRQGLARSSTKRNPSNEKNSIPSHHQCDHCGLTWKKNEVTNSYFALKCESRHKFCPLCFSSIMALKGSMHYFNCPACNTDDKSKERLTQWDIFAPQPTRQGGLRQKNETHSLTEPDSTLQPVLHHHAASVMNTKRGTVGADHATLSLSMTKTDNKGNKTLQAVSAKLNTNNLDSTTNETDKKKITTIFQLLHSILVSSSKKEFHRNYNESFFCDNGNEQLFSMSILDTTCLFQCMYALSTGKVPPIPSKVIELKSTEKKKIHIQVFTIAEMIRNQCILSKKKDNWRGERGVLKHFLGKQLMVNCAPQALYRILCQIGVSTTNETVRVDAIQDCKKKILKGYPLDGKKYDMFLLLFDNLGFRVRGGKDNKIGYEQYTALEIVNISKESLIEWGVYPNKENNEKEAARLQLLDVDKNWIENRKAELWESNDMKRMSKERVYQEKLKSELENKFFCLKDTQKYNEQRNANLNDLHCYTFNCPQSNENENESNNSMVDEHAGSSQQIVFSSDEDDDTHDGGIETEEHQNNKNSKRDSMGGKDLLANLGSLF